MHQRHPVRIDKSRALPAGNCRLTTGSTQVSFHKIYRQKRCYSNANRQKESCLNSNLNYDCGYNSIESNNSVDLRHGCEYTQRESNGHSEQRYNCTQRESNGHFEQRYDCTYNNRERNTFVEPKYSNTPSVFRTVRRNDFNEPLRSDSPSSSCLSTGNAKGDRDFPKRSAERFSFSFSPEPEFEEPVVKKKKVDFSKSLASEQCIPHDLDAKSKLSLDGTKWMYKNHHAKMSGPYGVKQLMEGFQSRFLQEDLPIYQLFDGKLCKPIALKQLMDDVKLLQRETGKSHVDQSIPSHCFSQMYMEERAVQEVEFPSSEFAPSMTPDSGRMQIHQGIPSQCLTQVYVEERCANEDDLPPGFGGRSSQFSKNCSTTYLPNNSASVPGVRCSAPSFSSIGSEFGDTDISLPPGFERGPPIESNTSEFCETPRNLSTTASLPVKRGGPDIHSGYDQLEQFVNDTVHSSWQGNSTQSMVGYSNQGPKAGRDLSSNEHASWTYSPATTSFEPQAFSQPTVCIGLPVSQTTHQSWPSASNFSGKTAMPTADPFSCRNESVPANSTVAMKESIGMPESQSQSSPDPLSLILSELLAAVKRTYVSSVLSALIGEQLDSWFDANKHWLVRSSSFGKDSPSGGTCQVLSRIDTCVSSVDHNALEIEVSASPEVCTVQVEASSDSISNPELLSERLIGRGAKGCSIGSGAPSSDKSLRFSLVGTINNAKLNAAKHRRDRLLSNNVEESGLGSAKVPPDSGEAENLSQVSDKNLESKNACVKSPKLSSSQGKEQNSAFVGLNGKIGCKSVQGVGNADSVTSKAHSSGRSSENALPNAKPLLIATRSKKGNMKSLKQIMLITSKLRSARLKSSLLKNTESRLSSSKSSEIVESSLKIGISSSEEYQTCARTSSCMVSWKQQNHEENQQLELEPSSGLQMPGQPAQAVSGSLGNFSGSVEDFDVANLTHLKMSKKRMKVSKSKIHKWGLFSFETVEPGEFIIEYVGELVRPRVADVREELYTKLGVGSGYLVRLDHENTIDATKRGGLARFINHSCDPNCYIKIVVVEGSKRVLFFAKQRIQAGDEVTCDYKFSHGMRNFPCNCGSSKCESLLKCKGSSE